MAKNKYSHTVLLPKTDFPMRAGLAQKEPKILDFWKSIHLYEAMLKKNEAGRHFVLHDGPPYANGKIHIGHALDKTIKDIILKSRAMSGCYTPYVPGWDCHGLPIEQALLKELKQDKKHITDVPAFRKKARAFAAKFIDIQRQGFKRLGVQGDWDNPYLTMSPRYEGITIGVFLDLIEKGYVYKGQKTITWCSHCETALADAETEYKDVKSSSIYLRFKLANPNKEVLGDLDYAKPISLVIWTTTPWTIPSNMAAAVSNTEDYVVLQDSNTREYYILAEKLAEEFLKVSGLDCTQAGKVPGANLVGMKYFHPLTHKENPIIWTDFVTMDTGTGIVHIAPGHGEDDFRAGKQWGLETFCPVDEKGCYTKDAGIFEGMHVFEANPLMVKKLDETGALIKEQEITHSYPHCWRCHNPIIFRATEQWFMSIDKDGLRQKLMDNLSNVKFYPAGGAERMRSMIGLRPDWCLSRQRFWGTPVTILYCKKCGKAQVNHELFDFIKTRAMDEGSDFWFTDPVEKLMPEGYHCDCGCHEFRKETDILDVWLDSGVSWAAVLKDRGLDFPADVYSEGSDQHRGWFQSSYIPSFTLEGTAPFKTILTHGMVLDQQGRPMHKSLGNSVDPEDVINKYGADILRLWVSFADYQGDVRISDEILGGPIDTYRKIRNTVRYALGNLSDYDPALHQVPGKELAEMDRYMLGRLDALIQEVHAGYEEFNFRRAMRAITDFCILDLSSFMLDASKDRLYTLGASSPARRSAQTVLAEIAVTLLQLMAPVLSFTAEEAWQELRKTALGRELPQSIFLSNMPANASLIPDVKLEEKWNKIRRVRETVQKVLEDSRQKGVIGSSLEAKVIFKTSKPEMKAFLQETKDLWPEIAIVSAVEIADGEDELSVSCEHASGHKCARCWQWKEDVGSNTQYADLCARCAEVLEKEHIQVDGEEKADA
ncbi:isoleucine--tRNA ligase [Candidatus Avelusimicrobium fimicolum]|jgi:isoleucyl-tRNA synthetase|uniref:isoleucine--tRNA ligase n=1 Tax=Candidatus Avelusimicrobium fimicolum TaxID=3416216 RepID=UPI003D0D3E05